MLLQCGFSSKEHFFRWSQYMFLDIGVMVIVINRDEDQDGGDNNNNNNNVDVLAESPTAKQGT